MHSWGEKGVDWEGIENSASEIGAFLARWGRMGVTQTKEKFGTVRVYCHFGWDCLHSIIWPRRHWIHKWWPFYIDLLLSRYILELLNNVVIPYQRFVYRRAYTLAVKKRPHLREEILCYADFGEILEGVAGYKHGDYWKEVE
jgi:hypothetical protein